MRTGVHRDLAVDVLVVGAGIPALHIAGALHPHLSVCVVAEPGVPYESYECAGRFSVGYEADDLVRVQHARRAAAFWRSWAASNGVPASPAPSVHGLPAHDETRQTRRWAEAGLAFSRLAPHEVPAPLADGAIAARPVYATPDDVVIDPARVAGRLRSTLDGRVVAATVERFSLITPGAVDRVELVLADGGTVPVSPRFVVLASDAANAGLLLKVSRAMRDRLRRRAALAVIRASQAVRRRLTIAVRGDLPLMTAAIDGLHITALPNPGQGGGDVVWLVQLPVDDGDTILGPESLRFPPTVDRKKTAEGLDRLFELSPQVSSRAHELGWSAFVARLTGHPLNDGGRARMETFGMDALVAAWPTHLANTAVLTDAVVQRVLRALGGPAPDPEAWPDDLPPPGPDEVRNRWQRTDFRWQDWPAFAKEIGVLG
jgi:hypothetical protein